MLETRRQHRPGFTIAELLVSMLIIAVIASALLVAVAGARESARKARTQAIVANIQEYIMHRWDSYVARPVPATRPLNLPAPLLRLDAIRELVRMEMPERKTDVEDNPQVLRTPPSLTLQYRRRASVNPNWGDTHQNAECLYMILASIQDEGGSALDSFSSTEIGDTDEDGLPEILDGFGNPIAWLRWAPAWRSPLQFKHDPTQGSQDPEFSPDGLDLAKADPRWTQNADPLDDPYALFPLIYSAGPDGEYGIFTETDPTAPFQYRTTSPRPNDPYDPFGNGTPSPFGSRIPGGGWEDNIDNHYSINE